jgi:hypothetical protein
MEKSKFELKKIEDINNFEQFKKRYDLFLSDFGPFMVGVLNKLKLKFKLIGIMRMECTLHDYLVDSTNSLKKGGRMNIRQDSKGYFSSIEKK